MKLNVIGFVAAIIALVSLLVPWWTFAASVTVMGFSASATTNVYPWATTIAYDLPAGVPKETFPSIISAEWWSYTALALVGICGFLGLVGSSINGVRGKMLLAVAGIIAIVSSIIFAYGLSSTLPSPLGLFYSKTYLGLKVSAYLSLGFWQALVAAVLAFISLASEPRSPLLPIRKMKKMEVCLSIVFIILLYASIVFAVVFPKVKVYEDITMLNISLALLLIDFPIALVAVIFASLSIREEEEEKTMPVT